MSTLTQNILGYASAQPEGTLLSAKELLHLGSRAAIDQALSRLAKEGVLCRVARGMYVPIKKSRFGSSTPSPEKIVKSLAEMKGEIVLSHGAVAANALGLTTQVPRTSLFVTSGRGRCLRLGKQIVELEHAPKWQFQLGATPAGEAVRALAWLGPKHAAKAAKTLKKRLPNEAVRALARARSQLPNWMAETVSSLAYG